MVLEMAVGSGSVSPSPSPVQKAGCRLWGPGGPKTALAGDLTLLSRIYGRSTTNLMSSTVGIFFSWLAHFGTYL